MITDSASRRSGFKSCFLFCVTVGGFLNFFKPSFLTCKMRTVKVTISLSFWSVIKIKDLMNVLQSLALLGGGLGISQVHGNIACPSFLLEEWCSMTYSGQGIMAGSRGCHFGAGV